MAHSASPFDDVVVATPTVAFGDLIRHSLEESGKYRVHLAHTAAQVRDVLAHTCCTVAILDSDLPDGSLRDLALDLQRRCPQVRLVLIPPQNDHEHPAVEGIHNAAYLHKPFYLPDLIELMANLTGANRLAETATAKTLHWINQPILDRLLMTTSAQAGAVAHRLGGFILGGSLPDGAEAPLSVLIGRFWQRDERSDLVRFARLEIPAGNYDCLVYITSLEASGETVAGLVYPINTPLSKVRSQAGPLTHALQELAGQHSVTSDPQAKTGESYEPRSSQLLSAQWEMPASIQDDATKEAGTTILDLPNSIPTSIEPAPPEPGDNPPVHAVEEYDNSRLWEDEEDLPSFNLADLLGSIPSPDPNGNGTQPANGSGGWVPELFFRSEGLPLDSETGASTASPGDKSQEPAAPSPEEKDEARLRWEREVLDAALSAPEPPVSDKPRGAFYRAEEVIPPRETPSPAAAPPPKPQEGDQLPTSPPPIEVSPAETHVPSALLDMTDEAAEAAGETGSVLTTLTSLDQLEPAVAGISLLNYTCVLIPRMPQHYLTGELSEKLGQWIHQICLAFGWRLEGIALRPDYMQWTVQVAPTISPGNIVKIVRQRTSEWIFAGFHILARQNPSGDFWATGYLLVSGSQPPSAGLLRDFIQQTRRRQGVAKPSGEPPSRLPS